MSIHSMNGITAAANSMSSILSREKLPISFFITVRIILSLTICSLSSFSLSNATWARIISSSLLFSIFLQFQLLDICLSS